jgi:hypothetical protein
MATTQDTNTVTIDGEEFPADAVLQAINGVIDPSTPQKDRRERTASYGYGFVMFIWPLAILAMLAVSGADGPNTK